MTWLRRLPGAVPFVLRGAGTSIAGNLSLAALALALSFSLWLYVTDAENPQEVRTFNSAIPIRFVNVPNDLAVANASEATVRIRIEAPSSDLDGLEQDDFEATVDLGGLARGTQNVAVEVSPSSGSIDIADVTPARIDVTLEDSRSKEVPVRVTLIGSPQTGFAAASTEVDPSNATVTGAESLVQLVDHVVAEVNLTALNVDITDERVPLQPRDARGGQISRVTVNPITASLAVEIEQRDFSLEFAVTPSISGEPAPGFNVESISIDPRVVVITGPLEVLQSIDAVRGVTTSEISIADAREDVTRTVELVVPEGARLQGVSTVRINVDISPAQGQFSFRVVPQVRNVADGLAVTQADPVTVTLSGDVPTLQGISAESITIVADASGLGAGLHALPLQITPPAGVTVVRVDPAELGIALTER